MGHAHGKHRSNSMDRFQSVSGIRASDPAVLKCSLPSSSISLEHTITERGGGDDLWVIAPDHSGWLIKQGFRWRKRWRKRWVALHGRELSCYSCQPNGAHNVPKYKVVLTDRAKVIEGSGTLLTLIPRPGDYPWILRACTEGEKKLWLRKLMDCIDILNWLQHYHVGRVLGVGGNGIVREICDKRNDTKFAVKIINAENFVCREAALSEVDILRNVTNFIRNDNLVQIYKVYEERGKIFIVLQLCTGGELYDRLIERGRYTERDASALLRQIMNALKALHSHNILHLDIKPENILFETADPQSRILLTDFGLARMMENNTTVNKVNQLKRRGPCGTVGYMAPEVIVAREYGPPADVFGVGVILYILLVGYPPFYGKTERETLERTSRGEYEMKREDWCDISWEAKDLVRKMLTVQASERISVEQVLSHPWLTQESSDVVLPATMSRMKKYNTSRKTKTTSCIMGLVLSDSFPGESLLDIRVIEAMFRGISPNGLIDSEVANRLSNDMGVSSLINRDRLLKFLDQDGDGMISAQDFCKGVTALRSLDDEFVSIIYEAFVNAPILAGRLENDPSPADSPTFGFLTSLLPKPCGDTSSIGKDNFEAALQLLGYNEEMQDPMLKDMLNYLGTSNRRLNIKEFKACLAQFPNLSDIFLYKPKRMLYSFIGSHFTEEEINTLRRVSKDSNQDEDQGTGNIPIEENSMLAHCDDCRQSCLLFDEIPVCSHIP